VAKKALLRLLQDVAAELGLTRPMSIIGNQDQTALQLLALANREGDECSHESGPTDGWQALRGEWVFNLVPGQSSYPFPSDLAFLIPETGWDRNYRWRTGSPMTPQEWQFYKSSLYPLAPFIRFRLFDGTLNIVPTPTGTDTLAFEYMSTSWCQSATGVGQSEWLADTDTYVLPDNLMTMGVKWRFLAAKGLDYAKELHDYQMAMSRAFANEAAVDSIPLNGRVTGLRLLDMNNVPDTGYGS
jgi:hypothetical protein